MGNQSARQLSTHRKHVVHTWNTINSHDPQLLSDAISEAWLKSAELTPTWVWALVDLPETMHATYKENAQFLNIINQVRDFLNILIKVHKCDPEMIKTLSFRLGARHRHYMNEGNDNCFWAPFAQQLPIAMSKMYMRVVTEDSKIRRILRIRSRAAEKSEEEEVCESWRQFSCMLIESMKRGYEGCASEKTPLRLSITNSIISMASMRSSRSRSASHFLEPNMSPAIAPMCALLGSTESNSTTTTTQPSSPITPYRRRSMFRAGGALQRNSQDFTALRNRRMSSPNNPSILLNNCDIQLLKLTSQLSPLEDQVKQNRVPGRAHQQRRSITLLNFDHHHRARSPTT
ncbi:GLOBIN domain-containing protein [Caenorhabditis elegans]|uniref:GLOBIN domain-containing protein n=1 Tax=Caenorhabditis elegans TaxID=6239 RepID=Q17884_CAEEL|nr:GLOBIN domain-containing protein [Caenorhabditis elegans]CAA90439.2 GLOBIN domain-containing protein [Caenorhabditis elegans]|eukprot:NP_496382.2 GLoBin related [Caenorhabditis elegans]